MCGSNAGSKNRCFNNARADGRSSGLRLKHCTREACQRLDATGESAWWLAIEHRHVQA